MSRSYPAHPGSAWVAKAVTRAMAAERNGTAVVPMPERYGAVNPSDIVDAVTGHRVVEVLAPHLDALGVVPEAANVLRLHRRRSTASALRLQLDTNAVSDSMHAHGIEHLVVKGVALASVMGLAPTGRGAGDIDLWVRAADVPAAEEILHERGWARQSDSLPKPSDGWRWSVMQAVGNELPQIADHASPVDLHWRLTPFAGEAIPGFDEAYRRSVPAAGLVPDLRTLHPVDALRHLCQHGRKDGWPTLRHVVDIVRLVRQCDPIEVAHMAGNEPNVAMGLAMTDWIGGSDVANWTPNRRTTRLCAEAWGGCLSLRGTLAQRNKAQGWDRVVTRARFEWWTFRSSPTLATRVSWAYKLATPLQVVVKPRHRSHPTQASSMT